MSGTGATINFGGASYNIDATKLSTATNAFTSHLGTIAGSGHKVVVGGVEYGIDSTKLTSAISDIEAVLGGVGEERLEGDGAEFYTLAPTALSFRSTAPLNELQEIQINGVTVDPSNYTLEEGSTIVTFPIDYLKTLNVGSYEVAVASDSKTVKGGFTVAAPELNEYGFYYNQPYTAYVAMLGDKVSFFVRNDGTFDSITGSGGIETGTYEISGNSIVSTNSLGTLHSIISADGMEIYCTEIATTFVLGDTSVVADEDYIYIYKEDLGGYEVKCIDKTKAEYSAIKTGINGIDTVAMADYMFAENANLIATPSIPNSITNIPFGAFDLCRALRFVAIPYRATSIDDCAFRGCTSLQDVVIPDGVVSIGIAFGGCSNLKSITLPFIGASKDETDNTHFGYIFGAHTVWENSTDVPKSLTDVVITNTKNINDRGFYGCDKIVNIVIHSGLITIGYQAFTGCSSLTSVTIPNGVATIGDYAFQGCTGLTSVIIDDSVTSIGYRAFANCVSLNSLTFNGKVAQWNTILKDAEWNFDVPATYVQCSDGQVSLV